MFAFIFRFPHGRYHATPWGRHVNEGAVAWPPEPYRLLRALIAVWNRKAERERFGEAAFEQLIEKLAETPPRYRLPTAIHAHSRHYMPQEKPGETSLVFDAFLRLDPSEELVVGWPALMLDPEDFTLAAHLAERIGYLGRAESVVIARAADAFADELDVRPGTQTEPGMICVDLLAPHPTANYAQLRPALLDKNRDKPNSKARKIFEETVPETLVEALGVETSQLQAAGWSRPPAGRFLTYVAPQVGPTPRLSRDGLPARRSPSGGKGSNPTVARLVLAGRPRPSIVDAVKIGETFRRALMGICGTPVPSILSGRGDDGRPLRDDPAHAHAFFLPEDHDSDGAIDHLVIYARKGLCKKTRGALEKISRLWIADRRTADEDGDHGRSEWRLALEGCGEPKDFDDSALLRRSRIFVSTTPYLRPRHLKSADAWRETRDMVRNECEHRGLPIPEVGSASEDGAGRQIQVGAAARSVLAFYRFRSRYGLVQPDRAGVGLRLVFPEEIDGPLALGFGCHYGLGLFRSTDAQ